ncbi:FprA family A-type flavoprotein [Candidatus Bathyarchaeota archaeon]|nr:FprA family A-type flavoprotein [Candidatus Bathyarchaeota archaeon]
MNKILIVYYSRSGNTKKMAIAIAEGAKNVSGVEVELKNYESPEKLVNFDAILIGAPTYHHGMTNNVKNFLEEIALHNVSLKDKIGAVFGSYGWSGEAPRLVLEVMKYKFGMKVIESPLLLKYAPDLDGLERCKEFGKKIAEELSI